MRSARRLDRTSDVGPRISFGLRTSDLGLLPPLRPAGRRDAFTLLEVLLAAAVFAVVLLAIHGVLFGALRLRNQATTALEEAAPLQQALAILQRDLANLVPPGGTLFGQLQTTPSLSATQTLAGTGLSAFNTASAKGRLVSPIFSTAAGLPDEAAPWGEVQRVLYFLAEPTNQSVGLDLYRSVTRNLLPPLLEQPEDQWLLGGLAEVVFSFFDGTQWLESWDSTLQPAKLPLAVKVELFLATPQTQPAQSEPITLVVPVSVQPGTNQTGPTLGGGS